MHLVRPFVFWWRAVKQRRPVDDVLREVRQVEQQVALELADEPANAAPAPAPPPSPAQASPLDPFRAGGADLIVQADALTAARKPADAYAVREQVIAELEKESREAGDAGPWRHERIVRQKLAAARDADRVAAGFVEQDDEEAIRWWRQASEQLGSLNLLDNDLEEEVAFLQQKVIGEAASANHRIAAAANFEGDAPRAIQHWGQAVRLLGYLIGRYKGQPAWVHDLRNIACRSAGALAHQLASEATSESREAGPEWQSAAELFTQLLDNYPQQPEWVPKLHESALRNAALAARNQALDVRESVLVEACNLWIKTVVLLDQLCTRYPDQPDWVSGYTTSVLVQAARDVFDLAQRMVPTDAEDTRQQRWQQAAVLLSRAMKADPSQSDWAMNCLRQASRHVQRQA